MEHILKILDPPLDERLLLFGVVIVGVLLEVALRDRFGQFVRQFRAAHVDQCIQFALEFFCTFGSQINLFRHPYPSLMLVMPGWCRRCRSIRRQSRAGHRGNITALQLAKAGTVPCAARRRAWQIPLEARLM